MIYVYVAILPGMDFRVVKGAHSHNEEWEKICMAREYPSASNALMYEKDLRVREALRNIQLDEMIATRRRRMASNLERD